MSRREARIWRLMAARLRSARGVVLLEFGVFAPLVLMAILFASDFLRVLYCEQQLEIACRALCDIEAHLKPGRRTNDSTPGGFTKYKTGTTTYDVSGCPGIEGQTVVMEYLEEEIGKSSNMKLLRQSGSGHAIYPRGYYYNQAGLAHTVLDLLSDPDAVAETIETTIKNEKAGEVISGFFEVVMKIVGALADFLTFRTDRYLLDIFPTDKVVAVSLSVMVEPTFNLTGAGKRLGLFYREPSYGDDNGEIIPMYQRDVDDRNHRERFYYKMPSFDTSPLAPLTYGRCMADVFKVWTDLLEN